MSTLAELNALPQSAFVARLAGVFEHSPWVAERAAAARPFASVPQLLDAMRAAVDAATPAEQLALIRAHPQLRPRAGTALTEASAGEQRRAGLAGASATQVALLDQLNAQYLQQFGFPFILAVKGHDPASIIERLRARLGADAASEQRTALTEIGRIAGYRLADLIHS
jgi:2-oxo-4-hydroxy-4-carboxy-5-ureidoimidazoline decarboxylase